MNGFLLVDKPAGWTSSDVVSYLKKSSICTNAAIPEHWIRK